VSARPMARAFGPEMRTIAIAPTPGAVASAAIVSSRRKVTSVSVCGAQLAADSRETSVLIRHCCAIDSTVLVS
jgi:hypothetical protein